MTTFTGDGRARPYAGVRHEMTTEQRLPRIFLIESECGLAMKQAETGGAREPTGGIDYWRASHKTGDLPQEWNERDRARADRAKHR